MEMLETWPRVFPMAGEIGWRILPRDPVIPTPAPQVLMDPLVPIVPLLLLLLLVLALAGIALLLLSALLLVISSRQQRRWPLRRSPARSGSGCSGAIRSNPCRCFCIWAPWPASPSP